MYRTQSEKAEILNGRLAMLGFVAAVGAYVLTGQVIPGIW
jgi:cell division protein FtsN